MMGKADGFLVYFGPALGEPIGNNQFRGSFLLANKLAEFIVLFQIEENTAHSESPRVPTSGIKKGPANCKAF